MSIFLYNYMIKSEIEKDILSDNISRFKSHITNAPISLLIKIIPFLCAWGSLSMLNILENKISVPINELPNKDICMRMSLISDNYDIVNYLNNKNCMNNDLMLRYYVCSGGSNQNIYSLLDNSWDSLLDNDIKNGLKNGSVNTIKFLSNKIKIPEDNYTYLTQEKQKELLNNNNIFNYYYNNNINIELILEILYERKIKNINFLKKILVIKKFIRSISHKLIKNNFYIIK